jgi:hypothetical protein
VTVQNMAYANMVWQNAFEGCLSALGWREEEK